MQNAEIVCESDGTTTVRVIELNSSSLVAFSLELQKLLNKTSFATDLVGISLGLGTLLKNGVASGSWVCVILPHMLLQLYVVSHVSGFGMGCLAAY